MRLSDPTCVLGRIVERLAAKNGLCAPSSSLVAASALGQIQTGARPVSPPPKAPDYEAGIRLARYRRCRSVQKDFVSYGRDREPYKAMKSAASIVEMMHFNTQPLSGRARCWKLLR